MIKDYIGLVIAIVGILILGGVIFYQSTTEASGFLFIVIGLAVNLTGVFVHMKRHRK